MILLLSTTTRETPRAVEAALSAARAAQVPLKVCFILDGSALEAIRERLARTGFAAEAGPRTTEAMADEYRSRAEAYLSQVAAAEPAVPVETALIEGPFLDAARREVEGAQRVFVSRKRRSQYSRILFEGAVEALMERAPGKVEIVDDD
ncbi:MAG: hypothetical protein D6729_15855 [Deltaproteobacteria bacterium]|nr:MAG: hypothetical protein D6729_15855 [Deltaproteobacteria bacterium]